MNLRLTVPRTVTTTKKTDIIQFSVLMQHWNASGYDINVITKSQIDHSLPEIFCVFCQLSHGICRIVAMVSVNKRSIEQFRKKDYISGVITDGIDKKLNLLEKILESAWFFSDNKYLSIPTAPHGHERDRPRANILSGDF